ncbi:MAG: hypothetical protein COA74_00165 [Gammaproteobacteria bacterium]|nr:MAG: hypothetical protein COA74_00165 [Gammaproteobacteria bacterium]
MNQTKDIQRADLLSRTHRLLWLYGQTGFGKTTLMRQHYAKNEQEKLWLDHKANSLEDEYQDFIQHHDVADATLYIDDIHLFKDSWLTQLFAQLPLHAKVIVTSQCFRPEINISLVLLNRFQVLDYKQLRLSFNDIMSLLPAHGTISPKDVYSISLGWPVLVALICNKVHLARNIEHLRDIVNCPPNSLANFAQHQLMHKITGQQRQFLIWLSIVDTLPKAILNHIEQVALADFCEHELNGLALHHETSWQLLPMLKHACFISINRSQPQGLFQFHISLAERFLSINDIKSAIILMLQIGEKEKAIAFLSRMGGLLEWIRHGLTNLIELNNLFSPQDAEQYETVAWLTCIVNYKLGNVSKSRKIVNLYWQRQDSEQLIWTVIDAMIKLHEGRIFDSSDLTRLNNFTQSDAQTGPFSRALINNLLAITWLQTGANDYAAISLTQAEKYYQALSDAQYGQTFIKVHQVHSLILGTQLSAAKQLLNRVSSEVQTYFSKDESIRTALKIVKLELNFLTGLVPAVRTVDQLIKKLNRNESWFDSYATLYPIAIKLAILQGNLNYIPKWFATAHAHLLENPMEYLDLLLSQLARVIILQCPELKGSLSGYIIDFPRLSISKLPWRLQAIEFELMLLTSNYDLQALKEVIKTTKKHHNNLLYFQAKVINTIATTHSFLPTDLIEELAEHQLIGMLWHIKQYVPESMLEAILKEHNRLGLVQDKSIKAPESLSPKEQLIHKLISANLRNKQIALEMDISEQTVKFHLKNIYRKLGVKSRREAALHLLDIKNS